MKRKTTQVIKVSLLIIISFLFEEKNANAQCGVTSTSWCLLGNSGTTGTNYVGTIDPVPLIFKTTETEWMRISPTGNVGIFTITPAYKLDVVGDINLTGALRIATNAGTIGQVLTSASGGANTWTTPTTGTVTSITAGTGLIGGSITTSGTIALSIPVSIANGGTNNTTIGVAGSVLYSNGTQQTSTLAGISGQVLTSSGTGMPTWATPTTGTITSVGLSLPSIFTVTGTPITSTGILTGTLASQPASFVFAGPISGVSATPTFRGLVATDLPTGNGNYIQNQTTADQVAGFRINGNGLFNGGNVGIGTTNPLANLEVKNGSVLFDGTAGNTPISGTGTRMMWIPSKAAFRAGAITSNQWDATNIGTFSTAFGYNTQAKGNYSSAFGYGTTAQSYNSFVIGSYNVVSGNPLLWVNTDPLFVIGNGGYDNETSSMHYYNALTVLKNGYVGIGTPNPKNKLDVQGGIVIGVSYAGIKVVPSNGAIIQGNVGIGTPTPVNKLDVQGGIAIGAGYAGIKIAPTDGAIIKGNVIIGQQKIITGPHINNKLSVDGKIVAKEVYVTISGWADYVFAKDYKLLSLPEVEKYIIENNHLPDVPSEKEIMKNGNNLGFTDVILLKKVEELTLYMIQLQKENKEMKALLEKITK